MVRYIITIGREYGSGGRYIARKTAELLHIPFYDRELLELAAEKSGINIDLFHHTDEKTGHGFRSVLSGAGGGIGSHLSASDMSINDKLFLIQADVIRKIAEEGSCVIVGRCANHVLADNPDLVSAFIHAPQHAKINRLATYYGIPKENALSVMAKTDKTRAAYYEYYSGKKWGNAGTYDISLNSEVLGIEGTAETIAVFAKRKAEILGAR